MIQDNESVIEILMRRDKIGMTSAAELVKETRDEILNSSDPFMEVDDIIASNLGLEPDYLEEILAS